MNQSIINQSSINQQPIINHQAYMSVDKRCSPDHRLDTQRTVCTRRLVSGECALGHPRRGSQADGFVRRAAPPHSVPPGADSVPRGLRTPGPSQSSCVLDRSEDGSVVEMNERRVDVGEQMRGPVSNTTFPCPISPRVCTAREPV